ncbi:hypothetical protein M5K25_025486 [Dendrobium thyrsiflorum]|uniref:Uncharacterized protein n=1 Tax=Dendrobium thyrsiflorum TaxID=117978 RepID=A0ABD0U9C9_DENTH
MIRSTVEKFKPQFGLPNGLQIQISNERPTVKGIDIGRPSKPFPTYSCSCTYLQAIDRFCLLDHHPEFRQTTTSRRSSARSPPKARSYSGPSLDARIYVGPPLEARSYARPPPETRIYVGPPLEARSFAEPSLDARVPLDHPLRPGVTPDDHVTPRVTLDHHLSSEVTPDHRLMPELRRTTA